MKQHASSQLLQLLIFIPVIIVTQFGSTNSTPLYSAFDAISIPEACVSVNELNDDVNSYSISVPLTLMCMKAFGSDDCTGNKAIITGNTRAFPAIKELSIRSFRKCQKSNGPDKLCPKPTAEKVRVNLRMNGDQPQWPSLRGDCNTLHVFSVLNFTLAFSVEDESHCVQLFASSDCTNPIQRVTSNSPSLPIYGIAPFSFGSFSLYDCSVPESTQSSETEGYKTDGKMMLVIIGSLVVIDVVLDFVVGIFIFVGLIHFCCKTIFANFRNVIG